MSAVASPAGTTHLYARYVPRELEYNADFEDRLMRVVLDAPASNEGLRILHEHDQEPAIQGVSVRASDIDQSALPRVNDAELPLPISDSRRVYASAVSGLRLTHPGGFLEGGPGLDPGEDTFARDFLTSNRRVDNHDHLQQLVQAEMDANLDLLQQRMRDRQKAMEHNEQIEKEIRNLVATHDLEMRMQRRMIEEQRTKKEARDKKRHERRVG